MPELQSRRGLIAAAAMGGLLVVAVLAVVFRPAVEELDPATPEGTVQRYVQALLDGNEQAAASFLRPSDEECEVFEPEFLDTVRVTLVDVATHDGSSDVQVRITTAGGEPPFDRYESSSEGEFELIRSADGSWQIDQAPWPFEVCEKR